MAPESTSDKRRPHRRRILTAIQCASLLATGWLVWSARWTPQLHSAGPGRLLVDVLGYTILAWAWSAVVTLGLYSIIPSEERRDMPADVFRTAATAVWFGPAMILLTEFSPAALLAALVLVVYASRLLYAQWLPQAADATVPPRRPPREPGNFEDCQLPRQIVWRERIPAVVVALCLEAGAVAIATHYPLLGAAWISMGTALLTVFSMSMGAADVGRPPTLPRSIVGILATVVLAILLSISGGGFGKGGISGGGDRSGQSRPTLVETARTLLRQLFYGETPGGTGTAAPEIPKKAPAVETGASGGYPGIILWPEIKPAVSLVAPLPAGAALIPGRPAQPYSIPFGGEYWIFRWPFAHPPAGSYFGRGSPAKMSFSSTDRTPLQMEANQRLDTPVNLRCCRGIEIEIANADSYPGTVNLELILLDAESGKSTGLRLGSQPVTSHPNVESTPVRPVRETLEFAVPAQPAMEQFDQLKVVFHRLRPHTDKSARISIERFVLLPR